MLYDLLCECLGQNCFIHLPFDRFKLVFVLVKASGSQVSPESQAAYLLTPAADDANAEALEACELPRGGPDAF